MVTSKSSVPISDFLLLRWVRALKRMFRLTLLALLLPCCRLNAADPDFSIALQLRPGVPLRLYTLKRFSKRLGDPVHAKLLEPVYAFDREIIPAGSLVDGRVSRLIPITTMARLSGFVAGDFTPYHQAEVEFTSVTFPDGKQLALHTAGNVGLTTVFDPNKKISPPPVQKRGAIAAAKQQVRGGIESVAESVRGPDKIERLEDVFVKRLPWHPQWTRKGTRFDAEITEGVSFGSAALTAAGLRLLGSPPEADTVVHARLITPLTSLDARNGEPVEAVLSQPLFADGNRLILPEGTTLTGTVTLAHRARFFHRGGQLRFAFEKVDLPDDMPRNFAPASLESSTPAVLEAAESSGKVPVKVDREGGAKAVESKTRLIAPLIAGMIAARAMDNDRNRFGGAERNTGGRTLGGGSGFGLLGALAAQSNRTVGRVLGFYGLGWSVYNAVVSRGSEVEFRKDAALDIRFGTHQRKPGLQP